MYLPENIRYMRKFMNMSQEELAERLGYKSYTTIQKWESGVSEPPLKKLKELSDIFEIDMDTLTDNRLLTEEEFFLPYVKQYADKYPNQLHNEPLGLSEQELTVINHFRQLNEIGKGKAIDYISDLVDNKKYSE